MIGWMVDTLVVSALLWGAAVASERVIIAYRWPVRFVPLLAMVGAVLLPLIGRLWPASLAPVARAADRIAPDLWTLPIPGGTDTVGSTYPWVVVAGWVLASGLLLALLVWSLNRVVRERRQWTRRSVGGVSVLISDTWGPAVVGLARASIVLPRWVMNLHGRLRRLVVMHEAQHVRAGDLRVLMFALGLVFLVPWNVFLWLLLRRLRAAVELDCDRRVLGAGVSVPDYARLLLEVGERGVWPVTPALAMAKPRSTLGRRIDTMTSDSIRWRGARTVASLSVATGLFLVACDASGPEAPTTTIEASKIALHEVVGDSTGARVSARVKLRPVAEDSVMELKLKVGGAHVEAFYRDGETDVGAEPHESQPYKLREIHERTNNEDIESSLGEAPLLVVDGVIVADQALIKDEAFESRIHVVEVIKGEAAVARYGSRAANGVILITTKQ